MDVDTQDRLVVVTGASGGIGHATVAALVGQGFKVWAGVRTDSTARDLHTEFGSGLRTLVFDVTDDAAVRRAASRVVADGPAVRLGQRRRHGSARGRWSTCRSSGSSVSSMSM